MILISIIIPCYNRAAYLPEALQSVLEQTYTNWECIIVDDGSVDNTAEIVKRYTDKDSRFKYFFQENRGVSSARNLALENCKGAFIQFLDSDDYILNDKIELSLKQFSRKDVTVVISNFRMFTDNLNKTTAPLYDLNEEPISLEALLYKWGESFTIPIHCGFFQSSFFEKFRFSEDIAFNEDWIMWVSYFYKNCKVSFLNEPLALYRINKNSTTKTKDFFPDFIKVIDHFKKELTHEEFYELSIVLISRFYRENKNSLEKYKAVRKSNSFRTGLKIKKYLKLLGLLGFSKYLLDFFLSINSKK
ncbi:MAG: hypothetical protein RLZZ540_312 [Bacteroidota bacterium]|jgi:glycosyltransferase involved in cell wall biosynthesis